MGTSRVVSLQLEDDEVSELERLSRQFGRSLGETAGVLLVEKLREEEFPCIEFRHSAAGRQAYIKGSSLAVWEVVLIGRSLGMDAGRVADYLGWPEEKAATALAYAAAYAAEIDPVVDEAETTEAARPQRVLPGLKAITV